MWFMICTNQNTNISYNVFHDALISTEHINTFQNYLHILQYVKLLESMDLSLIIHTCLTPPRLWTDSWDCLIHCCILITQHIIGAQEIFWLNRKTWGIMYKEFKFFPYFIKPIKFLNLIKLTSLILFLGIYPKEIIRATKINI